MHRWFRYFQGQSCLRVGPNGYDKPLIFHVGSASTVWQSMAKAWQSMAKHGKTQLPSPGASMHPDVMHPADSLTSSKHDTNSALSTFDTSPKFQTNMLEYECVWTKYSACVDSLVQNSTSIVRHGFSQVPGRPLKSTDER